MWHLPPGKSLPEGKAYRDSGVEMAPGCGRTGDDGKGNADGKGPADLEDGAKGSDSKLTGSIQSEARDGRNAGKAVPIRSAHFERRHLNVHVKEHPCCFGHAFSQ